MMSVLTQLLVVMVIVIIGKLIHRPLECVINICPTDGHISMPTLREWGVIGGSLVATALLEAYTWQIDNLILGLFQLTFLLAFS